METINNPRSPFYQLWKVTFSDLLRKGNNLSLKNPKKSIGEFKPDQVENLKDLLCVIKLIYLYREMCSPEQEKFFCRPMTKA